VTTLNPEKSAYPNTRGRPLRKRKQASLFPPFLRKKRLRTATRPPLITPTLATSPIQLTPREPPTAPIPGSLPLSTMGAATQKSDALPSVSHRVAETQEPVTHSVAETQEPAMAETQKTATAETQEPAADTEMELQNSDAQTSIVCNKRAETQSAIYLVAETQEPATSIEVELQGLETLDAEMAATQEPATSIEVELQELETLDAEMAATQEPATGLENKEVETQDAATPPSTTNMAEGPATYSVAETQKPPTDMEIDEILLSLHQEAETQASEAIPVAAPQEPAKETMTVTQEPVIPKSKPTMADVLQENEFLKSQLEQYQQELTRAREAYEKELTRYALERTAIMAERSTESICKEYMCCQCGNIYYQAGYKIVQVPVPGEAPTPSPFEVKTEPAETQEPAGPQIQKETPTAKKDVQTLPTEGLTPPSQVTLLHLQGTVHPNPTWSHHLQMLKLRLLTCGTKLLRFKSGRRTMLRHRTNSCKSTSKPGGITPSRIGKHWT
jgi:hypothetical protein